MTLNDFVLFTVDMLNECVDAAQTNGEPESDLAGMHNLLKALNAATTVNDQQRYSIADQYGILEHVEALADDVESDSELHKLALKYVI